MSTAPDQPAPIARPDKPPIWPLVIQDVRDLSSRHVLGSLGSDNAVVDDIVLAMAERDRVGREEYGTPLTAGNGRDHLVDAYQELLDAAVYLRAEIEEHGSGVDFLYSSTLALILALAEHIAARTESP